MLLPRGIRGASLSTAHTDPGSTIVTAAVMSITEVCFGAKEGHPPYEYGMARIFSAVSNQRAVKGDKVSSFTDLCEEGSTCGTT